MQESVTVQTNGSMLRVGARVEVQAEEGGGRLQWNVSSVSVRGCHPK